MARKGFLAALLILLVALPLVPVLGSSTAEAQEPYSPEAGNSTAEEAQCSSLVDILGANAAGSTVLDAANNGGGIFAGAESTVDYGGSDGGSAFNAIAPSTQWYFAEGCTTGDLKTLVNIVNPGNIAAMVVFVFYLPAGDLAGPSLEVAPGESRTIDIGEWTVADEVGFKVTSDQPVLVQRTLYGPGVIESNLGGTSLSTTHYFAEGFIREGIFWEWINIVNPGDTDAICTFEYYHPSGKATRVHEVAARSRLTIFVNAELDHEHEVSAKLSSTSPVHAERTMLGIRNEILLLHIAPGATETSNDWYFAPLSIWEPGNSFLILFNPENVPAFVLIEFSPEGETSEFAAINVAPDSRLLLDVYNFPGMRNTWAIRLHSDEPIACEFTSYIDHTSDYMEGVCRGGYCYTGNTVPARDFVLPGGPVTIDHEQRIGLANFGESDAEINLKAYTSQGTVTRKYSIPRTQSKLVSLNQDIIASGEIYYVELSSTCDFLAGKMDLYFSSGVPLPPGADHTWYFAEGCTRDGFSEYLCLQNPGNEDIEVYAAYMLPEGEIVQDLYPVPANSRSSVYVNSAVGDGNDVSVLLYGEDEFYAERPMYFNYKQGQPGYSWVGGHVTFGVQSPRTDWYFAEGCTRDGFEEWLCIQNPTEYKVEVSIDYFMTGSPAQQKQYSIPPLSRFSVNVNEDVGLGRDVSARVHSTMPIVCERPMYFRYNAAYNPGAWTGGHVVMGTSAPGREWYFAEGCTRAGFEEWLCIQNPNADTAVLDVTYASGGEVIERKYPVPGNSRYTLSLNTEVGLEKDVSCHVSSNRDIICERPLYFSYTGHGAPEWDGGSAEVGVSAPKTEWYFAEGYTGGTFHGWICIQNANEENASVKVIYNVQGATPRQKIHNVPQGRYTIFVNQDAGTDLQLSAHLISDKPIIAERSMYFSYNGWDGGHCAAGFAY